MAVLKRDAVNDLKRQFENATIKVGRVLAWKPSEGVKVKSAGDEHEALMKLKDAIDVAEAASTRKDWAKQEQQVWDRVVEATDELIGGEERAAELIARYGKPLEKLLKKVADMDKQIKKDYAADEACMKPLDPTEVNNFGFDDIEGLEYAKRSLQTLYIDAQIFTGLYRDPPKNVLLYGPPGNGKTLLAKAAVGELRRASLTTRVSARASPRTETKEIKETKSTVKDTGKSVV